MLEGGSPQAPYLGLPSVVALRLCAFGTWETDKNVYPTYGGQARSKEMLACDVA